MCVFLDIVNLSFPDLRVDHSHWTFNAHFQCPFHKVDDLVLTDHTTHYALYLCTCLYSSFNFSGY